MDTTQVLNVSLLSLGLGSWSAYPSAAMSSSTLWLGLERGALGLDMTAARYPLELDLRDASRKVAFPTAQQLVALHYDVASQQVVGVLAPWPDSVTTQPLLLVGRFADADANPRISAGSTPLAVDISLQSSASAALNDQSELVLLGAQGGRMDTVDLDGRLLVSISAPWGPTMPVSLAYEPFVFR